MAGATVAGQCPRCLLGLATAALPAEDDEDLLNPCQTRRFGDYELLAEVARGGMGIVYRARQASLGRELAIKMILGGEIAGDEARAMFQREARAAAALHHPNIVPVYETGEHEMLPYLTMRHVPGGQTIADWAATRRRDFPALAAAVALVARAVAHAHSHGILHRDLKPSNILWDPELGPQVTDFGLAKLLDEPAAQLTRTLHLVGSPAYMAPEQIEPADDGITTATDVYGIGAVLFELLTGSPPFAGRSTAETLRRVVEERAVLPANIPRDLRIVCLKCLAKQAADRYGTAADLAADLERFSRGEPVTATPQPLVRHIGSWMRRRPVTAGLGALLVLSVLVGLGTALRQWRQVEAAHAAQGIVLDQLRWREITRQAESADEAPVALARLAAQLRRDPGRWQAAMMAMSLVDQRPFPVLAGPPLDPWDPAFPPPVLAADGRWVASAGPDGVTLRETSSNRRLASYHPPAAVTALAAGGGALAYAGADGGVWLCRNPDDLPVKLPREGKPEPVTSLTASADGRIWLAAGDGFLEIHRPDNHPLRLSLDEPPAGLVLSSDGDRAVVWSRHHAFALNTADGSKIWRHEAPPEIRHASLSVDGSHLAVIDTNGRVHLRNFDRALELPTIESPFDDYSRGVFNPDGSRILLTGTSDNLAVHDTATGTRVSPPMRHFYEQLSLVGTADGTAALSFASDGRACLRDTTTGEVRLQAIRRDTHHDAKTSLAADGSSILVTPTRSPSGSRLPTVWRGTTPAPIVRRFHPIERSLSSSRISPDGRLAAFGPGPYSIVHDIATGCTLLDVPTRGHCYIHLFSPDGTRCYALTASGWRYGWSLADGTELWPPAREPGLIRPGELSPDGTRIVAGHNDGHIRIYDTADGRLVHTRPHPGEIKVIRFAPDGSGRFVSGSTDRLAHVWDVTTGQKLATLEGHTDKRIAAAWSPDSRFLATASYDRSARLWDARSGQPIGSPLPHAAWLSHLEISPDGKLLATGCRDGTLRFWHLPDGSPASPPLPQKSTVHTVRFTADGKAVLVVDHQGFRFWDPVRAEPLTLHVRDPMTSGVGMDSESWRAFMTADGSRVLTGVAAAGTALHTVAQPREPVPPWFPELLESLAQMRFDDAETPHLLDGSGLFEIRKTLINATGPYAEWARRVIAPDY